jgi:hypothetical protein
MPRQSQAPRMSIWSAAAKLPLSQLWNFHQTINQPSPQRQEILTSLPFYLFSLPTS